MAAMSISHYIKDIGRGKDGARAIDRAAAADLMGQVLDGQVSDLELGAFCLAMRIKGETPEEMAGFIAATAFVPANAADISGAGATFPYPIYSKWAAQGDPRAPRCRKILGKGSVEEIGARCGFRVSRNVDPSIPFGVSSRKRTALSKPRYRTTLTFGGRWLGSTMHKHPSIAVCLWQAAYWS